MERQRTHQLAADMAWAATAAALVAWPILALWGFKSGPHDEVAWIVGWGAALAAVPVIVAASRSARRARAAGRSRAPQILAIVAASLALTGAVVVTLFLILLASALEGALR
jgi:hypothetical protein